MLAEFDFQVLVHVDALLNEILRLGHFDVLERRDLGQVRRDHWIQLVLAKRAA